MLGGVRAQDASPALAVRAAVNHPLLVEPREDVIAAVVLHAHGAGTVALHRAGRHAQGGAYLRESERALGRELHQTRHEPITALLQVDAAGQAEVAHRVAGTGVRVACVGDGPDRGGELALARLRVELERIAPLKVTRRRLHLPRRLNRGRLRFGAHVIQHHHQHKLAVSRRSAGALGHAVTDESGSVRVPRLPLAALLVGQKRRPRRLDRAIGVEADGLQRFLQHIQKGFPFRCQRFEVRFKLHCFSLG